jgi:hypothetical protein
MFVSCVCLKKIIIFVAITEKIPLEHVGAVGRIILKCIWGRGSKLVWFIWLRITANGELLCSQQWNYGLLKMRQISWLLEQLLASKGGFFFFAAAMKQPQRPIISLAVRTDGERNATFSHFPHDLVQSVCALHKHESCVVTTCVLTTP